MKCPLFLEQWREHQGFIQVCLQGECAWWDDVCKCCSVKTLALALVRMIPPKGKPN